MRIPGKQDPVLAAEHVWCLDPVRAVMIASNGNDGPLPLTSQSFNRLVKQFHSLSSRIEGIEHIARDQYRIHLVRLRQLADLGKHGTLLG